MKAERVAGTRDFPPAEMRVRDYVERVMSDAVESFGYSKILFPVFERTELFQVKSGTLILILWRQ